jgi:predicted NUDIX family NTP pyrophosphohydrolase
MSRQSAGLLMYRKTGDSLEVFLVHPGGPFFARKDAGVWTIPKGEPEPGETPEDAARREFREETGLQPAGPFLPLGSIRQSGGKTVHAWAFEGDWKEEDGIICNQFEMIWPPRSGRIQSFPEIDRAAFFPIAQAREYLNPAQTAFLDRLQQQIRP